MNAQFWIASAMGLVFLGSGFFLQLVYFNVIPGEIAGEQHWMPVVGGVSIALGLICLLFALVETLSSTLSPSTSDRIRFVLAYGMALVVVTTLAVFVTRGAVVAWMSESAAAARISGGLTGSIYEYRLVLTLAAVVLDLLALVVWVVGFLGAMGALMRKRQA